MKQKRKGSVTKGHGSKLGSHQDIFKKMTVDMYQQLQAEREKIKLVVTLNKCRI